MNEKKNIDRLFQEKFKDFEVAPPEFVWQNIEAELEKKKKRRIIPLWFRLSGVAAIFIVGMFLLAPFINDDGDNNNGVVIENRETNADGSPKLTPTDNPVRQSQSINASEVATEENPSTGLQEKNIKENIAMPRLTDGNAVASQGSNDKTGRSTTTGEKRKGINSGNTKTTRTINSTSIQNDAVAQNDKNRNKPDNGNAAPNADRNKKGTDNNRKNNGAIPLPTNEGVAETVNETNGTSGNENTSGQGTVEIKIPEDIKTNEGVAGNDVVIDTATTVVPENELEKLLKEKIRGEKEATEVAENDKKEKWMIKPQMAPLFFNSASQGSPINEDLAANAKDYDNDLSYGVGINYALTDKLSVRSGVNTVNLRYSTNNIEFYATLGSSSNNIAASSGTTANLVVQSATSTPEPTSDELMVQKFSGNMVQKMGFIEVPLELSYKLLDRKFGVDIIGGVSTLFLNDNNVSVVSHQGFSTSMGEANNINRVHFSTNVGVGFKYRFWESFEANFEPMLKYQVNTFSSNAGNFKPYFIGLYSGISFSF